MSRHWLTWKLTIKPKDGSGDPTATWPRPDVNWRRPTSAKIEPGEICRNCRPNRPYQFAFEFGAGFSGKDEWLLRIFADAIMVVLAGEVSQSEVAATLTVLP
jgi:hypothetical protein